MEYEPWIEKYRSKKLDEIVGQDDIIKRLKVYVTNRNFPNLMFSGPPGCIAGDSVIFTDKGLLTMKQLFDKRIKDIKVRCVNTSNGEMEFKEIVNYFNIKEKSIIKIKTKFGFEIKCTPEHKIVALDSDGLLKFKQSKDLNVGDVVTILYGENCFGKNTKMRWDEKQALLFDSTPEVGTIQYFSNNQGGQHGYSCKYPYIINDELAEFLGYFISEGNINSHASNDVHITNTDKKINDRVSYLFKSLFGLASNTIIENRKDGMNYGNRISSVGIVTFLTRLGLSGKSRDKEVPYEILQSSKDIHITFLRALYSGDGYVNKEQRYVGYTSTSKKLCVYVQMMLLNLGIFSSLAENDAYCYEKYCGKVYNVTMWGENVLKFKDIIGFNLEYRQSDLNVICETIKEKGTWSSRTLKGLSGFIKKIYEEFKKQGRCNNIREYHTDSDGNKFYRCYTAKDALIMRNGKDIHEYIGKKLPTKEKLYKILISMKECSHLDEYNYLMRLCKSNFEYESIESIEFEKEDVYDLEIKDLHHYIANGFVVHNSGKTSAAITLAKEIFGNNWYGNFKELNASDSRGIDTVRNEIKNYANTQPLGQFEFKVLFLDECDNLTPDAQAAMRRTMEKYTSSCRFILSCNYSSKIIEPIQSRTAIFRFRGISPDAMKKRLTYIAKKEDLVVDEPVLDAIVYVAEFDMRKAVSCLEVASLMGKVITVESIYKSSGMARREDIREFIETSLRGNFISAFEKLDILMIEEGLSGLDIIKQMFKETMDLKINDKIKIDIIEKIGDVDFRVSEGANERIQLKYLITQLIKIGS